MNGRSAAFTALLLSLITVLLLASCGWVSIGYTDDEDDPPLIRTEEPAFPLPSETTGDGGAVSQNEGKWPDNEYTRRVPAPNFVIFMSTPDEDGFSAVSQSAKLEDVKAYAAKVKEAGFKIDIDETEQSVFGVAIYTFSADDGDGYHVDISFTAGSCAISISK
ncbi:MAG: hypothetical protein IKX86_06685 [Clostridia bacterium]|nr:hypothetical protein [Clostridia bacterium]